MAASKEHAHELIERLAPSQVSAVIGMLEALLDPVARTVANAPIRPHSIRSNHLLIRSLSAAVFVLHV